MDNLSSPDLMHLSCMCFMAGLALVLGDSADLVGEAVDILFNARDRRLSVDIMELQKVVVETKVMTPRRNSITSPTDGKPPTSSSATTAAAAVPAAHSTPTTVKPEFPAAPPSQQPPLVKQEVPEGTSPSCAASAKPPSTPLKIEVPAIPSSSPVTATTTAPTTTIPPSASAVSSSTPSLMMPVYRPAAPSSSACMFKTPIIPNDGKKRIGAYTIEERRLRIQKYLAKKQRRVWRKKIKYDCRKKLADNRPRIKGRFVKREEEEELEEHGAALQDDEALMTGLLTFDELLG